jgi:hypothetical protein
LKGRGGGEESVEQYANNEHEEILAKFKALAGPLKYVSFRVSVGSSLVKVHKLKKRRRDNVFGELKYPTQQALSSINKSSMKYALQ